MTLWVFCGMGGMYLIGMAYKVCEKECGERVTSLDRKSVV